MIDGDSWSVISQKRGFELFLNSFKLLKCRSRYGKTLNKFILKHENKVPSGGIIDSVLEFKR